MLTRKKDSAQKPSIDQALLDELNTLSLALAERGGLDRSVEHGVLAARLIRSLSLEEWMEIKELYALDSWFAIPVHAKSGEAVQAINTLLEDLSFQSDHDPLTRLANRRYLERYLKTELGRAERTGTTMSLIMLDLDYFKNVNDTYGHLCGDMVLQQLGKLLNRARRHYDMAARYGGEEFVLILPGIPAHNAKLTAERLLRRFSEIEFKCDGCPPFHMTFSGGVAWANQENGYCADPSVLLRQADEALYAAKRQGRNRIVIAGNPKCGNISTMVLAEEKKFLFSKME
jgi:diguanylate cyclase (GGDEF)-like protein